MTLAEQSCGSTETGVAPLWSIRTLPTPRQSRYADTPCTSPTVVRLRELARWCAFRWTTTTLAETSSAGVEAQLQASADGQLSARMRRQNGSTGLHSTVCQATGCPTAAARRRIPSAQPPPATERRWQ